MCGTTSPTTQVDYNPLHDQFFPSIGCAPCTRAISLGEEFRAGRWWWEDEAAKECGLHVKSLMGLESGVMCDGRVGTVGSSEVALRHTSSPPAPPHPPHTIQTALAIF